MLSRMRPTRAFLASTLPFAVQPSAACAPRHTPPPAVGEHSYLTKLQKNLEGARSYAASADAAASWTALRT